MPLFRHDRPMESPLGKKLRAAGYRSLWEYVGKHGFQTLDRLQEDVGFPTLTIRGFIDFVVASGRVDNRWAEAFRIVAVQRLNYARARYSDEDLGQDWKIIEPVSSLVVEFESDMPRVHELTHRMADFLRNHRELFDSEFSYDADWLVEIVDPFCREPG
jgi:hypothetical protein